MTTDAFNLQLADGLALRVSRIGYEDEGLRLTIFDQTPFKFHVELQLSRKDTKNLIKILEAKLSEERQVNMP